MGGACGLAVSAALLQATLRSHLPSHYRYLAHSTYATPSRASVSEADWSAILEAYAQASRAVFILQVPLIGVAFLLCLFIRDRGLERPKEPHEIEAEQQRKQQQERDATPANASADVKDVSAVCADVDVEKGKDNVVNVNLSCDEEDCTVENEGICMNRSRCSLKIEQA